MTGSSASFTLKNDLSELKTLFKNMEMFCVRLGLSNRCKCEMDLVLEELFTNIISHGFVDEDEHWIEITISVKDNLITMRIEDDGVPFNPVEFEVPDIDGPIEKREIGGLGVHLTKHFTEDIVYERRGNKNILILRKPVSE